MKKWISLLLVFALVLSCFSGCGHQAPEPVPDDIPEPEPEPIQPASEVSMDALDAMIREDMHIEDGMQIRETAEGYQFTFDYPIDERFVAEFSGTADENRMIRTVTSYAVNTGDNMDLEFFHTMDHQQLQDVAKLRVDPVYGQLTVAFLIVGATMILAVLSDQVDGNLDLLAEVFLKGRETPYTFMGWECAMTANDQELEISMIYVGSGQ